MKNIILQLKFPDAKYDRVKKVKFIEIKRCDCCGLGSVPGINIDHSDDEYGSVELCYGCLLENMEKSTQ